MDADTDDLTASIRQIPAVPKILDVVCGTTGLSFAAIVRITGHRWIACAVKDGMGLGMEPGRVLNVDATLCREVRDTLKPLIVNCVAEHPEVACHPAPGLYGFQSFISMPILLADGSLFGTIVAVDPEPAKLDRPETVDMFALFAELIATQLDGQSRLSDSTTALGDERDAAVLREQFIGILGHDLRNPLASLSSGTNLLLRTPLNDRAKMVIGLMQASIARMTELVGNMLDFTRTRLGSGVVLERCEAELEPTLVQVVAELQSVFPARQIETVLDLAQPCWVDKARIGQLLSNLLSNALTHGSATAPIRVLASGVGGGLVLKVVNAGAPIPPAAMEQLFKPFVRGLNQQGLGLGLHIAGEIARAHGGTIGVESSDTETCFTLTIPPRDQ